MPFVRFKSSCPVCGNPKLIFWTHYNCGGDLYLNEKAILFCNRCPQRDFMFRWKFDCESHSGGFRNGNTQGFYACLSNLYKINAPPQFILDVVNILYQHQYEMSQNY